ncbi:MAG: hypothetical protein KA712_09725 [Myxococcales bacterium]|nr:hypothetical protein [Myxococcales bacterium]
MTAATEPFETETMAELCARQGRFGAALSIYRNLLNAHPHHAAARRWQSKLAELEEAWQEDGGGPTLPHEVPLPGVPGVVAVTGQDAHGESAAIVAWALPATRTPPVLEVLLLVRGPEGIERVKRQLSLPASSGRMTLPVPGLHSAVAAVGLLSEGVFVPLARSALPVAP